MILGGKVRILSGKLSTYRVGVGRNNIGIHQILAVYIYIYNWAGKKNRINLFALHLKPLFPCWPLLVRNTSPNHKFIISIYFNYSLSLSSSALEVLELLSLLLLCSGAGAPPPPPPPPPLPPAAAPTAAAAAAAPAPSSRGSSTTTRTTTSDTKHQTSRTKHQTETPSQRHQAPEQHKHHQHRQHKHRHNWPPAQAIASSDSKSEVMEVLRGGCLAERKWGGWCGKRVLKVSFGVSFEYRLGYRLERPMKIQNPGCIYIKYILYIICVGYRLSIVWCIVFHIFYHKVDSSSIFLNIVFSCWPLQKIKRS